MDGIKTVLQKGNIFKVIADGYVTTIYPHASKRLKYVGKNANELINKLLSNGWSRRA